MSTILVYHDRARAVIASDDRAHCEDGAGIKHRLPGRHPKFVVLPPNGLCFGCVGRTEHTQRLLRGTLRMASENDLNFDALAVQLHFALARIWSQRRPATLCVDKLDAVLCGFDSRQQRIRSVFWLSDRGFVPVETTDDPNNRSAAIGAFEAEDEVLLQQFTDRMRQASGKGHCWIVLQMRKTIDQISGRRAEVIGLASYFATVNKHGLIDLPAEFPLPPSNPEPESMGAACGPGRMFVGSIVTPVAGGINTKGNNDGGAGAQSGFLPFIYPTTLLSQTVNSPAVLNNVNNCFDADTSTYADLICTADGVNNGTIDFSLYNFTPTLGPFQSVTFNCLYAIPNNTLSSGGAFSIQLSGPVIGTVTIASFIGTGTVPLTPVSYTLPNGINLGQLQVNVSYSVGAANASGGVFEVQIFEAGWLEAMQ